jgi:hypothetical protein
VTFEGPTPLGVILRVTIGAERDAQDATGRKFIAFANAGQ